MRFDPESMFIFVVIGITIVVAAGVGNWVATNLKRNNGGPFRRTPF
jgi:hypothetical protein